MILLADQKKELEILLNHHRAWVVAGIQMWPLDSCEKSGQICATHLHRPVGNAILATKCCLTLCYATVQITHRGKISAEPEMLPAFPAAPVHARLSTNTPFFHLHQDPSRDSSKHSKNRSIVINIQNFFFLPLVLGSSISCLMNFVKETWRENLHHISLSCFTQNFCKTL